MAQSIHAKRVAATRCHQKQPVVATNADTLLKLWHWFLPANLLPGITLHGNTSWKPTQLVIQAFCWTWSSARGLTEAFDDATQSCRHLGGPALTTYQGFMAALTKWSPTLCHTLMVTLRQRMKEIGGRFWRSDGWLAIAFDGSESSAPRTRSNEKAFCAANYGKGKTARYRKKKSKWMRRRNNKKNPATPPAPRVWMTMMWHMGLRLPWAWRLGPSNASERDHVMTMLEEEFPKKTLFCADAGFIGYSLWSKIMERGHDFLIRTGANVHLIVEAVNGQIVKEGRDQLVWCWPKDAQREGQPPLKLRLIHTRIKKTKVWLLTSVLDRENLTLAEVVDLYQMRWGIEVEFRGLKQTLNRAELRCHNAARVLVELDWSILGMAVAELWALKEQMAQHEAKSKTDVPRQRSLAKTMKALRWCQRRLHERCEAGGSLVDRLRESVIDSYERASSKRARYRPPNPDKKPLGDPKLRVANKDEQRKLKDLQLKLAA